MNRLIKLLILLSLLPVFVAAQNTTVTATVVDSDGTVWANAPYTLSFRGNPSNPNVNVYNIGGVLLNPAQLSYSGITNSSGVLSQAVYQNGVISPSGSQWTLQICPLSSAPSCGFINFSTGTLSSLNVSTLINAAITAPRFPAIAGAYGYADIEAQVIYAQGATYWNTTYQAQRWNVAGTWVQNLPTTGGTLTGNLNVTGSATLPNITGPTTLTGNLNVTGSGTFGSVNATGNIGGSLIGGILQASQFPGSDNGAKINAAVAYYQANGGVCSIVLSTSGIISTAPNIPLGCTLDVYAPQTLNVTWPIYHHGTLINFHGFSITANTGTNPAFDIGKASALVATAGTVNTSGTAVTWVSGPNFSDIDFGDQITIGGSTYNIASINSSTSLTILTSAGVQTGASYVVNMDPSNGIANNQTPLPPQLVDLTVSKGTSTGDVIRNTFTSDVVIRGFKVFGAFGWDYDSRGAITANIYGLTSTLQQSGISLADYTFAGFTSGSNANTFYSPSINSSATAGGSSIYIANTSEGNEFYGLHLEGNSNNTVINDVGGGNNLYQFTDYERNGTGSGYEIVIGSNNNSLIGPASLQSYNSYLLAFASGTTNNSIEHLQFNVTGAGGVAWNFFATSSGKALNNKIIAGSTTGPPTGNEDSSNNYTVNNLAIVGIGTTGAAAQTGASAGDFVIANGFYLRSDTSAHNATYRLIGSVAGTAGVSIDPSGQGATFGGTVKSIPAIAGVSTLVSGTVTVSNANSCTPSATCVYKLTNCAKNASTGIGTLSIGTVSSGTSFVINSLGPTASVLATDLSSVCWQVN